MSDHTSTAREIAAELGCSVATVNNHAQKLRLRLKGRTPEDHRALLRSLEGVRPRRRAHQVTDIGGAAPPPTKKRRRRSPASSGADRTRAVTRDVDAYFDRGKDLIEAIRARLEQLEEERRELNEKLEALLLLHPDQRD